MNRNKLQKILHNIACGIFIVVGVIGILRLILLAFFYNPQTKIINTIIYLIYAFFEILLGIFALIELKKKYFIKGRMK